MSEQQSKEYSQLFSTIGNKLLRNLPSLYTIQSEMKFTPITIQLAPLENCTSSCSFCSVSNRPLKSYLPFPKIEKLLRDFKLLGAHSLECSGGGQPDLYYDKENKKNINDIIECAYDLGYKIGIITNTNDLIRIKKENYSKIQWIRISLIKLEENCDPCDYNFRDFPYEKLAFSYIIYEGAEPSKNTFNNKYIYKPTSIESIERIAELVNLHPDIKFVRIAGNCLIKGKNAEVQKQYQDIIDRVDLHKRFFIKDIGNDDGPFNDGCFVGCIRPYIAPSPDGAGSYQIYTCTSHVLNTRNYDLAYSLGSIENVIEIWEKMNESYKLNGYPYEIKGNKGKNWCNSCEYCYYKGNNALLYTMCTQAPDEEFP